jgi:hypothetical protein
MSDENWIKVSLICAPEEGLVARIWAWILSRVCELFLNIGRL